MCRAQFITNSDVSGVERENGLCVLKEIQANNKLTFFLKKKVVIHSGIARSLCSKEDETNKKLSSSSSQKLILAVWRTKKR